MDLSKSFLKHVGQTSPFPIKLEVDRAEGCFIIDKFGNKYFDFTSGIAVSNLGHSHKPVINAIRDQAKKYIHSMVYGEFIESPQVKYAELLTSVLPKKLNCVYYCTSGSETVEAAMKLSKRKTGRSEIIYFKGSYHGSTHGALSVMGSEKLKAAYRPLLPNTKMLSYNNIAEVIDITEDTACVILEVVQAASGVTLANREWLTKVRERCTEVGALLIFDEIQTGFGRTGNLFAFQDYGIEPDILLLAKAIANGVPMGVLVSDKNLLDLFTKNPMLGHINTFGGNALACSAAIATLNTFLEDKEIINSIPNKADSIAEKLRNHPAVKDVTYKGFLMAIHLKDKETAYKFFDEALKNKVLLIGFLLNDACMRLAPPLIAKDREIKEAVRCLLLALDEIIDVNSNKKEPC